MFPANEFTAALGSEECKVRAGETCFLAKWYIHRGASSRSGGPRGRSVFLRQGHAGAYRKRAL